MKNKIRNSSRKQINDALTALDKCHNLFTEKPETKINSLTVSLEELIFDKLPTVDAQYRKRATDVAGNINTLKSYKEFAEIVFLKKDGPIGKLFQNQLFFKDYLSKRYKAKIVDNNKRLATQQESKASDNNKKTQQSASNTDANKDVEAIAQQDN